MDLFAETEQEEELPEQPVFRDYIQYFHDFAASVTAATSSEAVAHIARVHANKLKRLASADDPDLRVRVIHMRNLVKSQMRHLKT